MRIKTNQPLWTSVTLHGALIVGLFLSTIIGAFLPKQQPHVFEMVSEPNSSNPAQNRATPMLPPPELELPDLKPMNIADPVKPRPKPTPVKAVTKAPPQLMSAADFFKDNPEKNIKPRPPQPVGDYQAPTINTSQFQKNLQHNLPATLHHPSDSLSAAERTALQRYGDQLNSRLNRAWIKPANLAGVGLNVNVVFDVSHSGRISNVRLQPASGNAAFDASVEAAFKRVGSGGVTPTGQRHRFTMSFKMMD